MCGLLTLCFPLIDPSAIAFVLRVGMFRLQVLTCHRSGAQREFQGNLLYFAGGGMDRLGSIPWPDSQHGGSHISNASLHGTLLSHTILSRPSRLYMAGVPFPFDGGSTTFALQWKACTIVSIQCCRRVDGFLGEVPCVYCHPVQKRRRDTCRDVRSTSRLSKTL